MSRRLVISQACLWAAAIVGAALLRAPVFLTGIVLPALAVCALLPLMSARKGRSACFGARPTPCDSNRAT
jgi:hypothetical protein